MVKREKSIKISIENAGVVVNLIFLTNASSAWLQRAILQINGLHNLEIRLMINDASWLGQFHDASAGNVKDVQKTPTGSKRGSEVHWGLTLVLTHHWVCLV